MEEQIPQEQGLCELVKIVPNLNELQPPVKGGLRPSQQQK